MAQRPWPRLRVPFSSPEILASGASGFIFTVSDNVVVKIPLRFDDPTPDLQISSDDALKSFDRERILYSLLSSDDGPNRHPNFVQCFLETENFLFLQRLDMSLQTRLEQKTPLLIPDRTQYHWIRQIVSAVVWLERFDLFHGDLRPANILLDAASHIKLCDFGNATARGEGLPGVSYPFYRPTANFDAPIAGPVSEQFALASCIYSIRMGHEPLNNLSGPEQVKALIHGRLPSTAADSILGPVVSCCWRGDYTTLAQVEQEIDAAVGHLCDTRDHESNVMNPVTYHARRTECIQFLTKELDCYHSKGRNGPICCSKQD